MLRLECFHKILEPTLCIFGTLVPNFLAKMQEQTSPLATPSI